MILYHGTYIDIHSIDLDVCLTRILEKDSISLILNSRRRIWLFVSRDLFLKAPHVC